MEVTQLTKALEIIKDKNYKEIYITDLAFNDEAIDLVLNNKQLQERIIHLDHHSSGMSKNEYSFINTIPIKDGVKTCGTSLFYDYLKTNNPSSILESEYTVEFVELIRSYDTWDWKLENNTKARDLTTLFTVIGHEEFISKYSKELVKCNKNFTFNETDQLLIKK